VATQIKSMAQIRGGDIPGLGNAVFQGFRASVDFSILRLLAANFAAHYPDAKVILNNAQLRELYKSASDTIYAVSAAIASWNETRCLGQEDRPA